MCHVMNCTYSFRNITGEYEEDPRGSSSQNIKNFRPNEPSWVRHSHLPAAFRNLILPFRACEVYHNPVVSSPGALMVGVRAARTELRASWQLIY